MTTEEGCVECDATAVALRTALPPSHRRPRQVPVATAQEQAQPGPSQAQPLKILISVIAALASGPGPTRLDSYSSGAGVHVGIHRPTGEFHWDPSRSLIF